MEKARNADSSAEGTADSCDAWMQIAGGETSAERPGITRMMFLAVFFARLKLKAVPAAREQGPALSLPQKQKTSPQKSALPGTLG